MGNQLNSCSWKARYILCMEGKSGLLADSRKVDHQIPTVGLYASRKKIS